MGLLTQSLSPCSSALRSRISSRSLVNLTLSWWMIDTKRFRWSGLRPSSERRISENDRMDVMGVRTSWLTWDKKSSFCRWSSSKSVFASRSCCAIERSSSDFCSSSWEYSITCCVSSAMRIISSRDIESPATTFDNRTWAEAAPMELAISRSSFVMNSDETPRRDAASPLGISDDSKRALARSQPRTRSATKKSSSVVAEPRRICGCALGWRLKMSTKSVDWILSKALWFVARETQTKVTVLIRKVQKTEWTSGSTPSMPKSAWGRNIVIPHGPSATSWRTSGLDDSKLGRNIVQAQITKPTSMPLIAPCTVAWRQ